MSKKSTSNVKRVPVVYKGTLYESKYKLCKKFGITRQALGYHLNNGDSVDEAVDYLLGVSEKAIMESVTYKGIRYRSLHALCKALGIGRTTVDARLKNGETLEEALDSSIVRRRVKPVSVDGVAYTSIESVAKAFDIKRTTLEYYLNKIGSLDVTSSELLNLKFKRGITYKDKHYKNLESLVKALNLNFRRVQARLRYGWTLEEAITDEKYKHRENKQSEEVN